MTKSLEERRNCLQHYLTDLSLIPSIRESTTFRRFLGMDIECPEEYNLIGLSGSYLLSKENLEETQEEYDYDI